MADETGKLIKDLDIIEDADDDCDLVIEDISPKTMRIKLGTLKDYITQEVNTQVTNALSRISTNESAITTINNNITSINNDLSNLNNRVSQVYTLWEGTATEDNTISFSDSPYNYQIILCRVDDNTCPMYGVVNSTITFIAASGFVYTGGGNNTQYYVSFNDFSSDKKTATIYRCHYITHNQNSQHSARTVVNLIAVYGIIKKA